MRKTILLLCFVVLCLSGQAQERLSDKLREGYQRIDFDSVKTAVSRSESLYYYPTLFARFEKGDPTLTFEDYRMLYYGFSFQDRYAPLGDNPGRDNLDRFFEATPAGNYNTEQAKTLIGLVNEALQLEPFSLQLHNLLVYGYSVVGDTAKMLTSIRNFNTITEVILSSGSGIDKEAPWSVLYREDVADILASLDVRASRRVYITPTVEYYHLAEKKKEVKGFYFDLSRMYTKDFQKKQPDKRFEFNPLYNPKSKQFLKRNY